MSTHNLDRRTVLRGILAAMFTLCVPGVLCGAETSPKTTQKPGRAKKSKMSKVQSKYQDKPKGEQKCSTCINFIAPDACKVVEGKISANGWCMLWAKKQA